MSRSDSDSFPTRALGGRNFVAFFHPAYPYPAPPLLTLAATDHPANGSGIDYTTALEACGIVAGNRWDDAFIALNIPKGDHDGLWAKLHCSSWLRADSPAPYYFVVNLPNYRYPVVPSFDHWRFPHGALPPRWASLTAPEPEREPETEAEIDSRDTSGDNVSGCRPARGGDDYVGDDGMPHSTSAAVAGIAPFSHRLWFASNRMDKYFPRNPGAWADITRLRGDICNAFHARYKDLEGHRSSRLEVQHPSLLIEAILAKIDKNIAKHEDLSAIHRNSYIRREYLFARFAFHVLSDANYRFLGGAHKYTVRLFDIPRAEQYTTELYSDDITELCQIFPPVGTITVIGSRGRETPLTQHPEDSCDDDSAGEDEASPDYPYGDLIYRQAGRLRYRSPAYYAYRRHCDGYIAGTKHEEQTKDSGLQRPDSSSSSLSSIFTISAASLRTSLTDLRSESMIRSINTSHSIACRKHPLENEMIRNTSQPRKQSRLA